MCAVMEAENIWDLCIAQFRGGTVRRGGRGRGRAGPSPTSAALVTSSGVV